MEKFSSSSSRLKGDERPRIRKKEKEMIHKGKLSISTKRSFHYHVELFVDIRFDSNKLRVTLVRNEEREEWNFPFDIEERGGCYATVGNLEAGNEENKDEKEREQERSIPSV